jgi:hypothetical protein
MCNGSRITRTIEGGKETYTEEILGDGRGSDDERGRRRERATIG